MSEQLFMVRRPDGTLIRPELITTMAGAIVFSSEKDSGLSALVSGVRSWPALRDAAERAGYRIVRVTVED